MLMQVLTILTVLALPATIVAVVDDWFLAPRRRLAGNTADPPLRATIYFVLPVLLIAAVLRLLLSETLDFSLVLIIVVAVAGLVWLIDHLLLAPGRARAAAAAGVDPATVALPVTVDYARSFFPVAAIVLVIRAFIFEPFRIPSDSMMPTLLDGDFIIVNKFAYGLRLPVVDKKVVSIGEPQRGDVVVFHWPVNPSINYIKRLVGLPGDHVRVIGDQLIINGSPVPMTLDQRFDDGCYHNMRLSTEVLGKHKHHTLSCLTPFEIQAEPSFTCDRHMNINYQCVEPGDLARDRNDTQDDLVVPAGHYLMIGDNRDNSSDGRVWGFVPDNYLVGKATVIWFNWDLHRSGGPKWSRIGHSIE